MASPPSALALRVAGKRGTLPRDADVMGNAIRLFRADLITSGRSSGACRWYFARGDDASCGVLPGLLSGHGRIGRCPCACSTPECARDPSRGTREEVPPSASRSRPSAVRAQARARRGTLVHRSRCQQQPLAARVRGVGECVARWFVSDHQFQVSLPAARWTLPGSRTPVPEQLMTGGQADCRKVRHKRLALWCGGLGRRNYRCWCILWSFGAGALLGRRHVISNAMGTILQN
jgi:hypothetical protein